MKLLTRYILKEHFLPFLYDLLIVIFLLFTNFLLRAVDRFLGKGLPIDIILEYLLLNTAWIIALAAPVAVLVATLMAFGRFAEDNEITALLRRQLHSHPVACPHFFHPCCCSTYDVQQHRSASYEPQRKNAGQGYLPQATRFKRGGRLFHR